MGANDLNLDALVRAAGIDPDSADFKLRQALSEADDNLMESLVALRISNGLSIADVAERMKRREADVREFEQLSYDPYMSTVRRYAAAIGALVTHSVEQYPTYSTLPATSLGMNHPTTRLQ